MAKSYATTYCDGDQLGCTWAGASHASTSSRSAQYRGGGRVRDFETDYSVGVVAMQGWGMPEVKPATIDYATLPGGLVQHLKTGMRQWQLVFEAASPTLSAIHTARDYLVEAFKPDRVSPMQPVRLQYHGATTPVEIDAWYVGGLEGSLVGREGVVESPVARLLSEDPMWYDVEHNAVVLDEQISVADADYCLKRVGAIWSNISTAFNDTVFAILVTASDTVYIAGSFTNVGDANGDGIVRYNPTTGAFTSLGTGLNGTCYALAAAPNGDIYVGGDFTSAGGVANTARIARWDGSVWNAVGTGIASGAVNTLHFNTTGTLYVGGDFTNHGDANGDYVTSWNGSAWASLGTGMNGIVYSITSDSRGYIYAGGAFTLAGGVSNTVRIALWNGSTWSALGTGANGNVNTLIVRSDGRLYAGGAFTTLSGAEANYIGSWDGSAWTALGVGLTLTAFGMAWVGELLYVTGDFTSAGGLTTVDGLAVWNGSSWLYPDMSLTTGGATGRVVVVDGDDLYIGYNSLGARTTSATTTATNNGSRTACPKIKVVRSGGTTARVQYLKNETTGDTLYLNYSLLDGETLTINLDYQRDPTTGEAKTSGRKRITSSYFGNVIGRALLPGSDFATFGLAPGANTISLYVYEAGAPTVTAWAEWREPHWSVDGAI